MTLKRAVCCTKVASTHHMFRYQTGTHVTRRFLCICKASADLILSDEACIVLGTVAVPQVNSRQGQVMQILAKVDLCRTTYFTLKLGKPFTQVFWVGILYSLRGGYHRFRGNIYLHLQGRNTHNTIW
jgi:hypothetical protein